MKLPVFRIVGEAYGFVWLERRLFWSLAVPGIVILAISEAIYAWLLWIDLGRPEDFTEHLAIGLARGFSLTFVVTSVIASLVYFLVIVLYSVAWHRAYLLPDEPATTATAYRWGQRQTRFLFNYVKIFLGSAPLLFIFFFIAVIVGIGVRFLLGLVGLQQGAGGIAGIFANILVWLGLGYFFARLSLLFPATAIDKHMSFTACWDFTVGHGWRLLWIISLAAAPLWFLIFPINFLIERAHVGEIRGSLTLHLLQALVVQSFSFVALAAGVSGLSISYKRLCDAAATG